MKGTESAAHSRHRLTPKMLAMAPLLPAGLLGGSEDIVGGVSGSEEGAWTPSTVSGSLRAAVETGEPSLLLHLRLCLRQHVVGHRLQTTSFWARLRRSPSATIRARPHGSIVGECRVKLRCQMVQNQGRGIEASVGTVPVLRVPVLIEFTSHLQVDRSNLHRICKY